MANEKVDVVIVGAGASGSVYAAIMAKAGKKVVLLEARIMNVRPPYANFYRAALGAIDHASKGAFAALDANGQHAFIDAMRQGKLDGWQGPPAPFVYFLLRTDAVDVVYGTMEGYAQLGVPYMPHIAPTRSW